VDGYLRQHWEGAFTIGGAVSHESKRDCLEGATILAVFIVQLSSYQCSFSSSIQHSHSFSSSPHQTYSLALSTGAHSLRNDSPSLLVCFALNLLSGALQGCSLLIPPGPLSWYTPLGACPELVSPPRLMWFSSSRGSTFLRLEKGGIPDPAPVPPPNWGCRGPLGWFL
jgi:hypothetical protein